MINPEKTETEIKKEITDLFEIIGYRVIRLNSGGIKLGKRFIHLCEKGTPDLLLVGWDGIIFFLEIKKPGEKLKPEQKKVISNLRARGQKVYIFDSLESAKEIFFTGIKQDNE